MSASAPYATQASANTIFIPCTLGWCLQLVLCGIATDRAREVLLRKKTSMRYVGTIPLARPMLACAVLFNVLVGCMGYYDIMAWMTEQDRSHASISSFKWPDILTPIFSACVAATVQSFMAYRCWRITNKSLLCAIVAGAGILLALAGATWSLVESLHYANEGDPSPIFLPTQIMLWTSAIVDVIITVALSVHLTKMKRGFNAATDHFIDSLIRLSFETCFAPAFFSVLSASLYASFYNKGDLWNVFIATSAFIPSLYVISMIYCLEGTARSKRRMESSRGGPTPTYPTGSENTKRKAEAHKLALPLHQTTSIQWDPPAAWHSQLGHGEDIEKMPDIEDMAFVSLERADTAATDDTEAIQVVVEKKRTGVRHSLMPHRPDPVRRPSDRAAEGVTVVIEKCTVVDEDR